MKTNPDVLVVEVPRSRKSTMLLIYIAATVMAFLYLTDVTNARSLASTTDTLSALIWQYSLLGGGLAGIFSALMPRSKVTNALVVESTAAAVIAFDMLLYTGVLLFDPVTNGVPWATVVWIGIPIGLGSAIRSLEAMKDRHNRLLADRAIEIVNEQAPGGGSV